ncbi:MAG: hypothetical protein E6G34_00325 [Actinobacteria bacterium]|nr:MAG: hypothetical protein E6G34_00325 [Actinomycetota bacterium]
MRTLDHARSRPPRRRALAPALGLCAILALLVGGSTPSAAEQSGPVAIGGSEQSATVPIGPPAGSTGSEATTTPSATTTAPTGTTGSKAPAARTPQVQSQHAQGRSPASSKGGENASARRRAAREEARAGNEGANAGTRSGLRAPKPSALTPALPLSLSAPIGGIPSFFIESFRIPPFLLPIYQAAGSAYEVPWQVLAAINEVETDYGRDLAVSSAGAEGWMQFLPSSWALYGVDANGDGFRDPYNPADAIFAAARYLHAAGASGDLATAVFSYNHSQAYVESVLLRAKLLGGTPSELLGAITGLTEARFPVHAPSHFSDGFPLVGASARAARRTVPATAVYSQPRAPVIAVQDGKIVRIGHSPSLGRLISLRDAYGNTYTYSGLGSIAKLYPVLKPHAAAAGRAHAARHVANAEPRPTVPASAGTHAVSARARSVPAPEDAGIPALSLGIGTGLGSSPSPPQLPGAAPQAPARSEDVFGVLAAARPRAGLAGSARASRVVRVGADDVYLRPLHVGVTVIAGTVLGRLGGSSTRRGHSAAAAASGTAAQSQRMLFQIRPAGAGAPLIDPKPILDGWVALENSSVFRANGKNPFASTTPSAGQVLLESKQQLEQQVVSSPGIGIYACGRQDIETGQIDRRVLAVLEFLEVSGLKPTISALKCGHSDFTSTGNISEHASGDAVDISRINGVPIAGHQGPGSIADATIKKLLTLQGAMKPHQIISLMRYPGTDNTLAMADHYNHIHVGFFSPLEQAAVATSALSSAISPTQWTQLIARLGEIPNPAVASGPSSASIPDHPGVPPASARKGQARGNH